LVLKAVHEAGADHNTVVFFTSDNGPHLPMRLAGGSSGVFFEGKGTTWEGGFRAPAFVRWIGKVRSNSESSALVSSIDIFPTVRQLLMVGSGDEVVDGRSLVPILMRRNNSHHDCIFFYKGTPSMGLPPKEHDPSPGLWAVRCNKYKAHFLTSCKVMHYFGDFRCSAPKAIGNQLMLHGALLAEQTLKECMKKKSFHTCSSSLSSDTVVHHKPLIFNVEADPGEMFPIEVDSPEYNRSLASIMKAKRKHEASLVDVENQMAFPSDSGFQPCCSRSTHCVCNPENFAPPGGVCKPVFGKGFTNMSSIQTSWKSQQFNS